MPFALVAVGCLVVVGVLWDAFEVVVLPRRVMGSARFAQLFYRWTWRPWAAIARRLKGPRRETYLSFYAPLSLLFLLIFWASGLVLGFAGVQAGLGSGMSV